MVVSTPKEGRMNFAVSLWRLVQEDRLVRWASYATAGILWFAIAWADLHILVLGMGLVAVAFWWLRRQRDRRGWFQEREVDIDLL
jgi:O-antigen/teichoic acid export membrane protein